jgi:hypothetical protein
MEESPKEWWGDFTFETGATAQWEIGSLRIAVQRLPAEWLVAHEQIEESEDSLGWRFSFIDANIKEGKWSQIARFVAQSTTEQLTVRPALGDRSVVSRPFTPFTVQADEEVTIYVGTPLWFTLSIDSQEESLFEIPISRPSDTWFGPSTLEGELCYASRTYGRINMKNLTVDARLANTQLHIVNQSDDLLPVERISLPVPFLSLFATADGVLWTEAVKMAEERKTSLAEFDIEDGPPQVATGAPLVAPPRQAPQEGTLVRAFSVLTLQGFD